MGKATRRDKIREEILREARKQIKAMVKALLERLMREECALYLAEHPTKANEYYTRGRLTLADPSEALKVPRVHEGEFHPNILPYRRRTSPEISESILALYAAGVSTRAVPGFWRGSKGRSARPRASPA